MAENFQTYQEVDALSRLTVAISRVTCTGMLDGDTDIYLYKDKGAAWFDGSFVHLFTMSVTTSQQGGAKGVFWAMTNALNDFQGIDDANDSGLCLYALHGQTPNTTVIHIMELDSGTAYAETGGAGYTITEGTVYYIKLVRDESVGTFGTFYCYIYSNETRATLLSTLTLTLHTSAKNYRYIMPMMSYDVALPASKTMTAYTENLSFETWDNPAVSVPPTVTGENPTSIAATTATGNGHIVSLGLAAVTQHGHCWNTTGDPTTADSKTTNGAGAVGAFTSAATGLTAGTRYYIRAYATNSFGTDYSTGISFIAGDQSLSLMTYGNLSIVETRLHYVGNDGKEYYLQGTAV